MSTSLTALAVFNWALSSEESPPPQGDLLAPASLSELNEQLTQAMQQLTANAIAKLQWGMPPLEDKTPLSLSNTLLAAALGNIHIPQIAEAIIDTLPITNLSISDCVCRHQLIQPALMYLSPELAKACLRISPLTALLSQPDSIHNNSVLDIIDKIRSSRRGRCWLALELSKPIKQQEKRRWRTDVLLRIRRTEQQEDIGFVLDVYEAQRIHFHEPILKQLSDARNVLFDPIARTNHEQLEDALSVAKWWQPLWEVQRSQNDQIRQRFYLGYEYREALKFYQVSRQLVS